MTQIPLNKYEHKRFYEHTHDTTRIEFHIWEKLEKNQNMQREHKILYRWRATSIEIPSIAFLKPNQIIKWFLDSKNVFPYLEIEQNKKELIVMKWLTI